MDEEDTGKSTPLAKLMEVVEASLERVLERREEAQATKVAAIVVNALGAWRHEVDSDLRALRSLPSIVERHEERIRRIEQFIRQMDTLPPPAAE